MILNKFNSNRVASVHTVSRIWTTLLFGLVPHITFQESHRICCIGPWRERWFKKNIVGRVLAPCLLILLLSLTCLAWNLSLGYGVRSFPFHIHTWYGLNHHCQLLVFRPDSHHTDLRFDFNSMLLNTNRWLCEIRQFELTDTYSDYQMKRIFEINVTISLLNIGHSSTIWNCFDFIQIQVNQPMKHANTHGVITFHYADRPYEDDLGMGVLNVNFIWYRIILTGWTLVIALITCVSLISS